MGLLLLLTSALLSTYFHPGSTMDTIFTIRDVELVIEPGTNVSRETDVTLRCQAGVSTSGHEKLTYNYSIIKDSTIVYNKSTQSSAEFQYLLPSVRVSNSGKYSCKLNINGEEKKSKNKKLTVRGLSKPEIRIDKAEVTEGEEVTVDCSAPRETGSIYFFLYDNSEEIFEQQASSNKIQTKLRLSVGSHSIRCVYTVIVMTNSVRSEESEAVKVTVRELYFRPELMVTPKDNVYEGDRLDTVCTVNHLDTTEKLEIDLIEGDRLIARKNTTINYSMEAKPPSLTFHCTLKVRRVEKFAKETVQVTELFSAPTLTVSPAEIFQNESMTLTCRSESYASERIYKTDLNYTLNPDYNTQTVTVTDPGVFILTAPMYEFNYTCAATAKGIVKHSEILTVRPKVSVSSPHILVHGKAVMGQNIQIQCWSDYGTFPINYTLWADKEELATTTIQLPNQRAVFNINITKPEDINKYRCTARNSLREPSTSGRLEVNVIVPLSQLSMIVIPHPNAVIEGDDLTFICKVNGTPPIIFKLYRAGDRQPLNTTITSQNFMSYRVPVVSKKHSGKYYCEAVNDANKIVHSEGVTIEVYMAMWKKVLIVATVLLSVSVLVLVCVVYARSKKGRRGEATDLSVKPASPKSDDTFRVTLSHDTEVYNAPTDAVVFYDGKEGRVTNGTRDSVASLPADLSNRSSYSIPATV